MGENPAPLSAEERAELEALRSEKARRKQEAQDRRERAELERLKAERARDEREAASLEHARELRERNAKLMEPDDEDLRMPLGQKIVLAGILVLVVGIVIAMVLGRH